MKFKKVESVRQLQNICRKRTKEFFILLSGGARSSKALCWMPSLRKSAGAFWVPNEIDNSEQELTAKELFDESLTLIGKAIEAGAFYQYI